MKIYNTKSIKWKILIYVYVMFLLLIGSIGVQIIGLISSIEKVNHMDKVQFEFVQKSDELKLNVVQVQQYLTDTILGMEKSIKIRIFASILTIIAAFALTFITRRKVIYQVINPVRDISEKLSYISNGNLNIELSYEADDEIGRLSEDIRFMVSSLNQYIAEINNFMREMSDGNFELSTKVEFRGDFEKIKDSIEYFSQEMSTIISNISIASIQLDEGANQVSSSAQALAGGASSQNVFIEDLNLSIEKLSIKIQNSSQKADDASKIVLSLGDEAYNSNSKMQEMIGAMKNISESSNEIGKIIKTIEDIAFQTNILALNAAVEAARAGEAGKGFAVVADEVRNLASRSAQAAKNTTSLIEESIYAVENGVKMVNETASSLELLSDGINNVVDIISDVSLESIMQANEVKELENDIEQISEITHTIAATAEESSATSEELSNQSSSLKNMISKFNTK